MKITLEKLKSLQACQPQLELFELCFGESVVLTKDVMLKAPAQGFNLDWLVQNFLDKNQRDEYDRVVVQALEEYHRVKAQAWEEYKRVKTQAWKKYDRVTAPALEEV